ncbi:MAG TPA: glycosyltransferase 87 family protein [Candidatus Limnocylindrales bacterium]|nr:glycosyltransferase 87 family protein [Candidatus Limnocylindrales bacterium]
MSSGPPSGWLPALAIGLALVGLLWLMAGLVALPGSVSWGYDYRAYVDAAVRLGETGTMYQAETLAGPYRPGPFGLYMYAPPLGVALLPMKELDLGTGAAAWYLLHVLALALACAILPIRVTLRLACFGVAALGYAVSRDAALGNVSTLLLLPLAVAWRWLDQPIGSIAQALAISVRPTLGILLAWQLLRRRWRAVAWTLGAGLALIALTLPFVGIRGYADYLTVLRNLSGVSGVERNVDLSSTALALGWGEQAATGLLLAGYGVAIGAIVLSLRRDREVGFVVTVSASLLLSPLLWDHYLAMLVLPAALLAERGRPIALGLPLLSWLPSELLPFVALAATVLPFWAREADPGRGESRQDTAVAVRTGPSVVTRSAAMGRGRATADRWP